MALTELALRAPGQVARAAGFVDLGAFLQGGARGPRSAGRLAAASLSVRGVEARGEARGPRASRRGIVPE